MVLPNVNLVLKANFIICPIFQVTKLSSKYISKSSVRANSSVYNLTRFVYLLTLVITPNCDEVVAMYGAAAVIAEDEVTKLILLIGNTVAEVYPGIVLFIFILLFDFVNSIPGPAFNTSVLY